MEKIKRCDNCGKFLGENSFHWQNKEKKFRQSICKKCTKIYGKEYRQENKEKQRDQKKKYYNENKKYILKQHKKWRNENRNKIKDVVKEWRGRNKERINEYHRKYYKDNKNRAKEWYDKYYQDHKDEKKKYVKKYKIKNKEKIQVFTNRRRARKINAIPNDVDMKKVNYMYSLCNKLNEIYGYIKYHVDHIKPLSKGGLHYENNLQILEAKLNMEKNDSYPLEKKFEGVMYKNLEACNCLIKMLKSQRIKNMSVL